MLSKLQTIKTKINDIDNLFLTLEKELPKLFIDSDIAYTFFNGEYDNEYLLDQIIICYEIKTYIEKNREHIKKSLRKNKDPYDLYVEKHSKNALTKHNFNDLYNSLNQISIDNRFLSISSKAQKIVERLIALNVSVESQIDIIDSIISDYYSGIQNATKYLIKDDTFDDCYKRLQQISNAIYKDRQLAIDALLYLSFDNSYTDAPLETTFIYNNFLKRIDENCNKLSFVEPSPFFARKLFNDPKLTNFNITIYLSNDILIKGFNHACKKENITFDSLNSILNKPAKVVLSDALFVFGNNINDSTVIEKLIEPLVNLSYQNNKIIILDGDSRLTKKSNISELISRLKINDISLLPGEINNSTQPARKTIIEALNTGDVKDSFKVINYKLLKDLKVQTISSKTTTITVGKSKYDNFNTSFRKLFRDIDYLKNGSKRNSYRYEFSKELIIKYSLSNGTRLRAEMINPFAGNNAKKTIAFTRVSTILKNGMDPEMWLENYYPYSIYRDTNFKSTVQKETSTLLKAYKLKSMTLKTFMYVYKEDINFIPVSFDSLYFEIIKSDISDIYIDRINEEHIISTINALLIKYSKVSSQYHLVNIFKKIFDIAISKGISKCNPANSLTKEINFNDLTIYEIKEALAINYLSHERRKSIIEHCVKTMNKKPGVSLGIMLRLFLAMFPKEICALTWGSFIKQDDFYCLVITKEISKDNNIVSISNQRRIRVIPVGPYLTEMILKEKQRQLDLYSANNKDFNNMPIIKGTNIISDSKFKYMLPETIYIESQKLLKKFDIPDEFITIPTNNDVDIDVDLTNTRGDIFRTNYQHYIGFKKLCDADICAYLKGVKGLDVFSDHYCDYKNTVSLKKIYLVQEKIEEVLRNG